MLDTGSGLRSLAELDQAARVRSEAASGPIDVIDLFCGCGGLSLGFETIGRLERESFRLAGAVDLDPPAVATYGANLPIVPIVADLLAAAKDKRSRSRLISSLNLRDGATRVLVGGPPCQGFSAHQKRNQKIDPRNALVVAFARFAVDLRPDFIVMENVPELLSGRHWEVFKATEKILVNAGYMVRARVAKVAEYGVPQERFRALVLAAPFDFDMPDGFVETSDFVTVREAIGGLPAVAAGEQGPDDPAHVSAKHRSSTIEVIRQVPLDGGSRPAGVGPPCLDRVDGFRDVYGRLAWDRPANTITGYARNPASGRFVHPAQDRALTLREAALLQSFPEWFDFVGSFDARFSQVGNAVPPRFATGIAAHVLQELRRRGAGAGRSHELDVQSPVSNSFSSGLAGLKRGVALG